MGQTMDVETLTGITVLTTGFHGSNFFSDADLIEVAAAAQDPTAPTIPLTLTLTDAASGQVVKPEGLPRLGTLSNLRKAGTRLLADAVNVPAKVAQAYRAGTVQVAEAVLRFGQRIGGKVYAKSLKSLGLAGVGPITDLASITALFSEAEQGTVKYVQFTEDLNAARIDAAGVRHKEFSMANDSD